MIVPWRDRRGKFLPFKAAVLTSAFIPGILYAFWWITGDLGARPVLGVIHGTGLWAIRFLMISLAITPAARILTWPGLLLVRRMLGLTALAYGVMHLGLYVADQNFALGTVVSEILKRFYLTIGFVTLAGLAALGVTSTNAMIKRMGRWWKRLHRLVYPLVALGTFHYFLQVKANVSEPVFVAGLYVWLIVWRLLPMAWQRGLVAYPALAIVAGVATAGIEFAWYALATHIDPWRVLAVNMNLNFGLRPAHFVFLAGLAVTILTLGRRLAGTFGTARSGNPVTVRST